MSKNKDKIKYFHSLSKNQSTKLLTIQIVINSPFFFLQRDKLDKMIEISIS